ncbi:hypothetical protein XENOCAPTIV_029730 [Xenoophorus captivus]|uniref:Uncharacterized protein n=1 Tax=Xenoophorus captivus TaxID=1517983 RepID=A0ABV0SD44_9TELE
MQKKNLILMTHFFPFVAKLLRALDGEGGRNYMPGVGNEIKESLTAFLKKRKKKKKTPWDSTPRSFLQLFTTGRFTVAQFSRRTSTRGPELHKSPMLTRNCLLLFLWILVNEGSVFSSRQPSSSLGRSRSGRERGRSSVGSMRNGAAGFQRVKRGWVWNQFFVLEEYMGSDPQYVGKVKSFPAVIYGTAEVINQALRCMGEIESMVNGGSKGT